MNLQKFSPNCPPVSNQLGSDDAAGWQSPTAAGQHFSPEPVQPECVERCRTPADCRWRSLQVTTLLNRAVTLATELDRCLSTSQATAWTRSISPSLPKSAPSVIRPTSTHRGLRTTQLSTPAMNDLGQQHTSTTIGALTTTALALNATDLTSTTDAQTALTAISVPSTRLQPTAVRSASVNQLSALRQSKHRSDQPDQRANAVQNADIGATVAR